MTDELKLLLEKELAILDDAVNVLSYSLEKCAEIGTKDHYTPDELDRYESLTSRFARLSDIVTQKIFRIIDEIDLETQGTVRDRINRAEKKGLIKSAETFVKIRMLRNDIAHEHLPAAIKSIYRKVLALTPELLTSITAIKEYCGKYRDS